MPRPRDLIDGKKTGQITIRLSEKDELKAHRISAETGIPVAVLGRIWFLKGIAQSSREDGFDDNLSSSDFAALGDS